MFGSADVQKLSKDKLLIESLTMADPKEDRRVKTIVKPRYVKLIDHPHFPQLKGGYTQVTENGEHFYGPYSPSVSMNILKINHYWARDWNFFIARKVNRIHLINPNITSEEDKQARVNDLIKNNHEVSQQYDSSILKFVPELRRKVFKK